MASVTNDPKGVLCMMLNNNSTTSENKNNTYTANFGKRVWEGLVEAREHLLSVREEELPNFFAELAGIACEQADSFEDAKVQLTRVLDTIGRDMRSNEVDEQSIPEASDAESLEFAESSTKEAVSDEKLSESYLHRVTVMDGRSFYDFVTFMDRHPCMMPIMANLVHVVVILWDLENFCAQNALSLQELVWSAQCHEVELTMLESKPIRALPWMQTAPRRDCYDSWLLAKYAFYAKELYGNAHVCVDFADESAKAIYEDELKWRSVYKANP